MVDLKAELEPVKNYLRTSKITTNTVLAAHMRALGVAPHGDAWVRAKAAVRAGSTLEEAARVVAGDSASAPAHGSVPARSNPVSTAATELTSDRLAADPMNWYPQRFEPGAIQGDGAKKLLGQPRVSLEDMLVRETAQNSWDARVSGQSVEFVMNLRDLSSEVVQLLRDSVFTGGASGTNLRDAFTDDAMWVVEISDRGTSGLGGPVRNDRAIPDGTPTHFIDLVFSIGATKDDPGAGGTYGFGKSISYMASELGAVIIWSRCRTDAGTEDRLIASAIGDVFELDGYRYTGRHWWGRTVDGRPEPLVGPRARELAEQIFAKGFEEDELGTSLIILEPQLGAAGPDDDADVLVESVLWNLWPKLLTDEDGRRQMEVRVQVNGVDVEIPDPAEHAMISGSVACLEAVRAVQNGQPIPHTLFSTDVVEIKRYSEVLGHLALMKFPLVGRTMTEEDGHYSGRSVTLMRNEAELVVRRLPGPPLADAGFVWAGVFKPVKALDSTFAKSEPPAHDDWSPASLSNKVQRSQVKVALDKIRKAVDDFVSPASNRAPSSATVSTAALGDALAGFMGGVEGSAPSKSRGGKGGSRSARASARVEPVGWAPGEEPGWTQTTLRVSVVGGDPSGSPVSVKVRVGTDGGTERDPQPDFVRELGWSGRHDANGPAVIQPREPQTYVFEAREDIAVDVIATVVRGEAE